MVSAYADAGRSSPACTTRLSSNAATTAARFSVSDAAAEHREDRGGHERMEDPLLATLLERLDLDLPLSRADECPEVAHPRHRVGLTETQRPAQAFATRVS